MKRRRSRRITGGENPPEVFRTIQLPEAKRGFVLLPRRWVVERSFAWATRFRRLVKDYERYAETLAGLHVVAFACLMMKQAVAIAAGS